jgi:hypothetical protein
MSLFYGTTLKIPVAYCNSTRKQPVASRRKVLQPVQVCYANEPDMFGSLSYLDLLQPIATPIQWNSQSDIFRTASCCQARLLWPAIRKHYGAVELRRQVEIFIESVRKEVCLWKCSDASI